jgi:hypothetical protein
MSRRVEGHGDQPCPSGVGTLEAVASAQQRRVLQRTLGERVCSRWPLCGGYDDATVDEMLCMQLRG